MTTIASSASLFLLIANAVIAADALPPYQLLRANEDWSAARNDPDLPPLKYIALASDGETWLSLGGELRERFDAFDAPRFGIGRAADDYLLQRVLVHADLHFNSRIRLFAQLGREDSIGKKPPLSVSDTDRGDVQNLFVDIAPDEERHTTLRFGRQELMFNATQRFVSVREGPNVRQSFDGARAMWKAEDWNIDLFTTRPVLYKIGAFDDRSDTSQAFSGAYVSKKIGSSAIDAYLFDLRRDAVQFGHTHGDERRESAGTRIAGQQGAFDYDAEAMIQWGDFAGRDIRAWAVGLISGYTMKATWSPRIGLELDAGSGDHGNPNGDLGTFNPLFPKGAYFDETALISWANSIIVRPSLTVQPLASVSVRASIIARWREDTRDAVYLQPYVPLAPTLSNHARDVGQACELDATWRANRNFTLTAEVAHNRAGPAITRAGGKDADFAMLIAQYRY